MHFGLTQVQQMEIQEALQTHLALHKLRKYETPQFPQVAIVKNSPASKLDRRTMLLPPRLAEKILSYSYLGTVMKNCADLTLKILRKSRPWQSGKKIQWLQKLLFTK